MRLIKKITLLILLVSFCRTVFAQNPAHINLSSGAQCQLSGNVKLVLHGNLINSGIFSASGYSDIKFSGTTLETIGGTGTTQFQNADLNNSANFRLTGNVSVNDTLNLLAGTLNLKNYNLTMGSTAAINGTFGINTMIIADATNNSSAGQLMKVYPAGASNFTFPIGDTTATTDYSPVTLNFTANSALRTIGVNVADKQDPNDNSTNNYLSRYWNFTDNLCSGTYMYNATFTYSTNPPTDLVGTYNSADVFWWNGQWNKITTTYPGAPVYVVSGVDQTTGSLCGTQFTGRPGGCNAATFSLQPIAPATVQCSPASANFIVAASGDGVVSYQWQVNNGTWNNISDGGTSPKYTGSSTSQLSILNSQFTAQYRCMASNCLGLNNTPSSAVTLTITTAPVVSFVTPSKLKCSRDSVLFKVAISNQQSALSYQWTSKGKSITGATNSAYIIGLVIQSDTGKYYCSITNACGSTSAYSTLSVGAPVLDTIQNMTQCAGTGVNFKVIATGANLNYQWSEGGSNITGATNSIYSISKIQLSDGNFYSCSVTNICGTRELNPFLLTVNQKPTINIGSLTMTKNQGDSVSLSLSPSGTLPFTYQWYLNSKKIPATSYQLTVKNIACKDAGVYSSVISNSCGSTTALIATLNVNGCNTISGTVTYDNAANTAMINTVVYLKNSEGQKLDSATTDNTGAYAFYNVQNGMDSLICGSTTMKWGGCNPVDALAINRYFVGLIKTFGGDNALRKRAADVNNDTHINPLDALAINRRFVGLIKKFNIPNWLFDEPVVNVDGASVIQNIKAICAGDVNGSYPR